MNETLEPTIIYEDEAVLALDKPAGITVNNSDTTHGDLTVQDWVEKRMTNDKLQMTNDESDFYKRAGIVHRIDKETSGILLVAKTPESFVELQRQFKERLVHKVYLALAHGTVEQQEGEIRVPVGRLPWNRKRFGVVAGGREAVTKFRITNQELRINGEPLTLLELYPETGRTHQIRVHLQYIGHPIFGDYLYAGRKTQRDDRKVLPRVFLHAAKITFLHPISGKEMTLESPLPQDLAHVLAEAGKKMSG